MLEEGAKNLLALGRVAEKFNKSPAEYLGILDRVFAIDFDTAAALRCAIEDKRIADSIKREAGGI